MSIEKKDKLLMDTAMLAGEIMLSSGAETYRVEDTMNHILRTSNHQSIEAFTLMTGIVATMNDETMEQPLTLAKTIKSRTTNLSNIIQVNEISRSYCSGRMSLEDAYQRLKGVRKNIYSRTAYNIATAIVVIGFAIMFGGTLTDILAAVGVGILLALCMYTGKKIRMNPIFMDIFCSMMISISAIAMQTYLLPTMNRDIVIVSAIMPMVPGVAITNAIRDTLHGDYLSGCARILEAFLKAASVAIGVAVGMALFHMTLGGVAS